MDTAPSTGDGVKAGQETSTTIQNKLWSPLLRLPAELRNRVYDYVLGGLVWHLYAGSSIKCYTEQIFAKHNRYEDLTGASDPKRNYLAILSTCRQINAEAALLPFALNTFSHHYSLEHGFYQGLSALQRAAIKSIKIKFEWIHVVGPAQCLTLDQDELEFAFIDLLPSIETIKVQIIDASLSTWNAQGREQIWEALEEWMESLLGTRCRSGVDYRIHCETRKLIGGTTC